VVRLAGLYYGTNIEPAVESMRSKLLSEEDKLLGRLVERGIDSTTLLVKALDPSEPYSKWELLGSGLKAALDIDRSRGVRRRVRGPYEYLVRLPRAVR
jgi:hypothetical protein